MFKRIVNFVNNIRIDIAFKGYEEKCHSKYIREGEIQFTTSELHADRNRIEREIENAADKIFKKNIDELQQKIEGINLEIISNEKLLEFFLRDYKNELAVAYDAQKAILAEKLILIAKLRELKTDLSAAYDGKKESYSEAESHQVDIDCWYDDAESSHWFGGNKGRKIPNHSFFGQSHGDLACSCSGRSDAYDNVGYWRGEIDRLKGERSNVHNRLDAIKLKLDDLAKSIFQIKADREHTFSLRKEGHRDHKLKSQIRELQLRLEQENVELRKQGFARFGFVEEKTNASEIAAIGNKIQSTIEERAKYLTLFDLEENKTKRKADHRATWLKERNKT